MLDDLLYKHTCVIVRKLIFFSICEKAGIEMRGAYISSKPVI